MGQPTTTVDGGGLLNYSEANFDLLLANISYMPPIVGDSAIKDAVVSTLFFALQGIVTPFFSLIGVITNLLNIIVLSYVTKRSRTPVYHLLLAMAIADFCLMGVMFLYCMRFYARSEPLATKEDVGHPPNVDVPSYFFFHTWDSFANICGMASNWCVVAVTTFRFIAVYFPLHAPVWSTRRRAVIVIPTIFTLAIVVNVPYSLANQYVEGYFVLQTELHESFKTSYYVVLLLVYHIIPWIACIALVSLLLFSLRSQQRITRASYKQEEQKNSEQRKLSCTLIAVALWFIISSAPMVVYHCLTFAYDESEQFFLLPAVQKFFAVAQMFLLTNYAANFFVYALINQTYRTHLMAIICRRKALNDGVTVIGRRSMQQNVSVVSTNLSASSELHPRAGAGCLCRMMQHLSKPIYNTRAADGTPQLSKQPETHS